MIIRNNPQRITLGIFMALLLSACTGGGSGVSSTNGSGSTPPPASSGVLSGIVAKGDPVGEPIVVTIRPITGAFITVKCAQGGPFNTTTSSRGNWSVTLTNASLPCVAQSSLGQIDGAGPTLHNVKYHGIATSAGVLNLTPLTDLVVSNVLRQADLPVWFSSAASSAIGAIAASQVSASVAAEAAAMNVGPMTLLGANNPMTVAFAPVVGEINSNLLSTYAHALQLSLAGVTTTMNQGAADAGFTVPSAFTTSLSGLSALPLGVSTAYYDFHYIPSVVGQPTSTATLLNNGLNVATGSLSFGVSGTTSATAYPVTGGFTFVAPIVAMTRVGVDTVDNFAPGVTSVCQTISATQTTTDVLVSKHAVAVTTAADMANVTLSTHDFNCAAYAGDSATFGSDGSLTLIEEGSVFTFTAPQVTSMLSGTLIGTGSNNTAILAYRLSGVSYLIFNRGNALTGATSGAVHFYY